MTLASILAQLRKGNYQEARHATEAYKGTLSDKDLFSTELAELFPFCEHLTREHLLSALAFLEAMVFSRLCQYAGVSANSDLQALMDSYDGSFEALSKASAADCSEEGVPAQSAPLAECARILDGTPFLAFVLYALHPVSVCRNPVTSLQRLDVLTTLCTRFMLAPGQPHDRKSLAVWKARLASVYVSVYCVHVARRHYRSAIATMKRLIDISDRYSADVYEQLGRLLLHLGNPDGLSLLREVAAILPDGAEPSAGEDARTIGLREAYTMYVDGITCICTDGDYAKAAGQFKALYNASKAKAAERVLAPAALRLALPGTAASDAATFTHLLAGLALAEDGLHEDECAGGCGEFYVNDDIAMVAGVNYAVCVLYAGDVHMALYVLRELTDNLPARKNKATVKRLYDDIYLMKGAAQ